MGERQEPEPTQYVIDLYSELCKHRFLEVQEFVVHSRASMKTTWPKFEATFSAATAGYSKGQVDRYADSIAADVTVLQDLAPQLLRRAHCLIVYSTFEHALGDICRAVKSDLAISEAVTPRAKASDSEKYLSKYVGAETMIFQGEWAWLNGFRIACNGLAESGGYIRDCPDRTTLEHFVDASSELITLSESGDIFVEDGLVNMAIVQARVAINRIVAAIKHRLET